MLIAENCCLDSLQIKPTLISSPLSTIKPESTEALPVAPDDNTISGSLTTTFVVLTVVVFPLTVKSPPIIILPVVCIVVADTEPADIAPEVVKLLLVRDNPAAFAVVISLELTFTSPKVDVPVTPNVVDSVVVATSLPIAP